MKTQNKSKKRGFTLVELLVVIAILAILATVSIVGYSQFIRKANLSNDQTAIGVINRNLQAASVNNEPVYAGDAISLLYGVGFNEGKLQAYTSGCHYAYSLENNMFYLVDGSEVIYPSADVELSDLWGLYNNNGSDYIQGVNKYVALNSVYDETEFERFQNNFNSSTTATTAGLFAPAVAYADETDPATESKLILDLGGNVFDVSSEKITLAIELQNGFSAVTDTDSNSKITVNEDKNATAMDSITSKENLGYKIVKNDVPNSYYRKDTTISNKIIKISGDLTAAGKAGDGVLFSIYDCTVTFENCVFSGGLKYAFAGNGCLNFKNCKFVDAGNAKNFSLMLNCSNGTFEALKFTLTDCVFNNCQNAICIGGMNKDCVIENCTFKMKNDSENSVAMLIGAWSYYTWTGSGTSIQKHDYLPMSDNNCTKYTNYFGELKVGETALTVKNNKFLNCDTVLRLSSTLYKTGTTKLGAIQDYKYFATFSDNTFTNVKNKVVLAEGYNNETIKDTNEDTNEDTNNSKTLKTWAEEALKYYQDNIK